MTQNEILKMYEEYLLRLVKENSPRIFTNEGIGYASRLMSILIRHTNRRIIMYCDAFKADLITQEPYWSALKDFLKDNDKELCVLVDSDFAMNQRPMQLLFSTMRSEMPHAKITVKRITEEGREAFKDLNLGNKCNFSVFDDKMFRFETDIEKFEAFGSFNKPDYCEELTKRFNIAYNIAVPLPA